PSGSMAAPVAARPSGGRPRAARPPAARRPAQPLIWIDVAGAVRRPGLYSLPAGARVAAALERAGGARAHADRAAVNLAAKLADGQQVFVPSRGHGGSTGSAGIGAAGSGGVATRGPVAVGGAIGSAGTDGLAPGARVSLSNA